MNLSEHEVHQQANHYIQEVNGKVEKLLKLKYGDSFIKLDEMNTYVVENGDDKIPCIPQRKVVNVELSQKDIVHRKKKNFVAAEVYNSFVSIVNGLLNSGEGELHLVKYGNLQQYNNYDYERNTAELKVSFNFSAILV